MKRRWLHWTLAAIGAVVLIAILGVLWVLNTASGTRFALARVQSAMGTKLAIESSSGTIAGPLSLTGLQYNDPVSGLQASVKRIVVDAALLDLLGMRVRVVDAEIEGVDVTLGQTAEEPLQDEPKEPFTLQAPIDLVVERFALRDLAVRQADAELVRIDSALFIGSWIGTRVDVQQLEVDSPQGEVRFAGNVSEADTYAGEGSGRFRWNVGESTYAGTIEAHAKADDAVIDLGLSSPLRADLGIRLKQNDSLPWTFTFRVPSFDPRESLMPDSSWESLAADLTGNGTLERGVVQGRIVLNGEPFEFERLAFERSEESLQLALLMAVGGGRLEAQGDVQLASEPTAAKMTATWNDISIPEQFAGQALRTEGSLNFDGSSDAYQATGRMKLGPPDQVADIELDVRGSPSSVVLDQFDIVQPKGRLAATGEIGLQPHVTWSIKANAKSFDPGHFAVEWPGSLNFALETEGALEEEGPTASVRLSDLRGQLRGRAIAGRADMTLASNMNLSGQADLRSGASRIRLDAKPGEATDAIARIDVPALDDWVPNAGGAVRGTFSALGRWPNIAIDGQARATDLRFQDMHAQTLQLNLDVTNPTEPDGFVELRLRDASAAGIEIESLRANASGNAQAHTFQMTMTGAPVSTELALEGSLVETSWSGTLGQLVLDVKDAATLTLQEPVQINYGEEGTTVSQACFADGDIRLCFDGGLRPDGSMTARYSLAEVPLALANAFASADSALQFSGTLRGEGDIERTADGAMAGNARIQSSRAEIAQRISESDPAQVLLTIADLDLLANLNADRATAQIGARLNDTGQLSGEVSAVGLTEPATQVNGSIAANLPSISIIELFVPQLANVNGAIDLKANVQGTLDAPEISGALELTEFSADVPEFGLKLKDGRVRVTPREDQTYALEGHIASGKGELNLNGVARLEGTSTLSINGKDFLAADMPGARVLIAPALDIEHVAERVTIKGQVTIPEATVNLQELPGGGGGGAKASSDVVIVDAESQEDADEQALPIHADVRVILGDKVELAGFGLVANVAGQLAVRERPGEPTTGSGEIRVGGTYKAYGQDLRIQQGSLLFANTPIDNPNLRIVATRQVGEIIAGLRVTGNAKSPVLTVFSEPEMGQADALSYLVAGKPLDEIGRGGDGEGDALQTAARSLGTAAGGLMAKNLGKRLGIDEFGITDNEMIGGSAFTIGQYLSPRLYLSYGVGLFEPGEVVTLRYKLIESLAVQVESGTEESRAGLEYRIER